MKRPIAIAWACGACPRCWHPTEAETQACIDGHTAPGTGRAPLGEPWRGRLEFDPNVSEHWPVVKGTWITAGHVVSLVVDGWTWSDILRAHPELNVDDIRTCLAYTIAESSGEI